jgi:hypothetical protein
LDNGVDENKDKLVTNDEKLDLIHKLEGDVTKIDNHKKMFRGKSLLKTGNTKEEKPA